MKKDTYQKLRLQEFNNFDMERLLKGVIDDLEENNQDKEAILIDPPFELPASLQETFADDIQNNSAEVIRVSSILTHTDDIYSYFSNGPLFRKDRDAK